MIRYALVFLLVDPSLAAAQMTPEEFTAATESMRLAGELATVIGSADACEYQVDEQAVARWVEENVAADDMGFANNLNLFLMGVPASVDSMMPPQKSAHCTAVRRNADAAKLLR